MFKNKWILCSLIFIILFTIYFVSSQSTYIESFDTTQDNEFVKEQKQYYTYRKNNELTGANTYLDTSQIDKFYTFDENASKGNQLIMQTSNIPLSVLQSNQAILEDEDDGQLIKTCKTITSCNDLANNPKCGYCYSTKQFEAGDSNGPFFNVCPSGWSNSVEACKKYEEQAICSKVKSCQTMTGDASICGWCQSSGKAFVATKDSTGKLVPKYSEDVCKDEDDLGFGLIPPGQCKQFNQDHPCIGPNMDTGPHSDACLDTLWKEAGGTTSGTAAPQNNTQQVKDWNAKSWKAVFDDMKAWVSDANSNNWNLVKTHYKGVYGKDPDPCDPKFSPTPLECYQTLFTKNGCLEKGKAYPNQNNYANYKTQSKQSFIETIKQFVSNSHNNSLSYDKKNSAYENCYGGELTKPPPLKPGDRVEYTGGTFYGPNSILQGYICSVSNGKAKVFWAYISGPDGNPHYLREGSHTDQVKMSKMGAYCGQVPPELVGKNVPSEINVNDLKLLEACSSDPTCKTSNCAMQNIVYVYYTKRVSRQFKTYNVLQSQIRDVLERSMKVFPSVRIADYSDIQYLVNANFAYCYSGWVNKNGTFVAVYPSNTTSASGCGGGNQEVIEWGYSSSQIAGVYVYIDADPSTIPSKLNTVGLTGSIVATVGKKSYTGNTQFKFSNNTYPKYLGCFKDSSTSTRALPKFIGDNLTVEQAFGSALGLGYKYVGLQDASQFGWNRVQAWTGNNTDFNRYGSATNCKVLNTDKTKYVGGQWVNAVYQLKD